MKKTFFYFDDVIWLFRDLTRGNYDSIFDHFYLKVFKEAHEKYGLKVQMNVFYRTDYFYGTDEFTLSEMTDKYKAEFEACSDWLRFGYHSKQEFPDYPLINISYEDMTKDFLSIKNEVIRFAGEKSFSNVVCSHWRPISKAGCRALADNGIVLINSTGGDTRELEEDLSTLPYGHSFRVLHNRQPETKLFTRISLDKAISTSVCAYNHLTQKQLDETNLNFKAVYDEEIGVYFKQLLTHGTVINLSKLEDMEEEYKKLLPCEFASFGGHEQYFYPDYFAYQPDHGEKLLKACQIMSDAGFEFAFADDILKINR
ncbi:MAG: hypothetical protein J6E38_07765 [Clostridia bacterium]|nr:hypothetical protein [Clostridia bacterium]